MTTQALDNDAVTALETPPEGDPPGKADFDVVIWNWAGDVDPNSLLDILTTSSIGSNSDTFFSNPQLRRADASSRARRPIRSSARPSSTEMQQLAYDQAPYHILFYDAALHAYRTDKFGGWTLQPDQGGLPFFALRQPRLQLADRARAGRDPGPSLQAPASGGTGLVDGRGGRRQPGPSPAHVDSASSSANTTAAARRGARCSSSSPSSCFAPAASVGRRREEE